jgi:hypothetical protein
MQDSIPQSAAEPGMGFPSYKETIKVIAQKVSQTRSMPMEARLEILARADKELSPDLKARAHNLAESLSWDKGFYKLAGLRYLVGQAYSGKLFATAIASYFLENQQNQQNQQNQDKYNQSK